jgi:DNA-binding NarL/FixJ family response regulator
MMVKPRILLADDDGDYLQALLTLLASEFEIVDCVGDGYALIEAAMAHGPDVIVTDISMPRLNGLRAARQLRMDKPNTPIVFLTVREDPAFLAEAQKLGALGYVVKRSASSDLVPAIRTVLQGRSFISSTLREPDPPSNS